MLLDSNIIIYAGKPEQSALRKLIEENAPPAVSAISVVEVLGYYKLSADERRHFEAFFASSTVLPVSEPVIQEAVRRQAGKLKLGDALIAATALVHDHILVTCNVKDFSGIPGLKVLDPLAT